MVKAFEARNDGFNRSYLTKAVLDALQHLHGKTSKKNFVEVDAAATEDIYNFSDNVKKKALPKSSKVSKLNKNLRLQYAVNK